MTGTLFVVATPIGNLEDLTFRALRTLREVDVIAAEDTRRTAKLLAHYEIRKPLVSLREHNESRETPRLLELLESGKAIALVSDAGTPTIADPGTRLVRAAHQRHLPVVPVPGPSAVVSALSVSGFSGDEFVFLGFPPSSGSARQRWLDALSAERRVVVFFEAPHRIRRTVTDLAAKLGDRPMFMARELTKRFEQLAIWQNTQARDLPDVGEFTVVVAASSAEATQAPADPAKAVELFGRLTDLAGFRREEALEIVAAVTKCSPSEIHKIVKKHKILAERQSRSSP